MEVDLCDEVEGTDPDDRDVSDNDEPVVPTINVVSPTALWNKKRDDLAAAMWVQRTNG